MQRVPPQFGPPGPAPSSPHLLQPFREDDRGVPYRRAAVLGVGVLLHAQLRAQEVEQHLGLVVRVPALVAVLLAPGAHGRRAFRYPAVRQSPAPCVRRRARGASCGSAPIQHARPRRPAARGDVGGQATAPCGRSHSTVVPGLWPRRSPGSTKSGPGSPRGELRTAGGSCAHPRTRQARICSERSETARGPPRKWPGAGGVVPTPGTPAPAAPGQPGNVRAIESARIDPRCGRQPGRASKRSSRHRAEGRAPAITSETPSEMAELRSPTELPRGVRGGPQSEPWGSQGERD